MSSSVCNNIVRDCVIQTVVLQESDANGRIVATNGKSSKHGLHQHVAKYFAAKWTTYSLKNGRSLTPGYWEVVGVLTSALRCKKLLSLDQCRYV